MKIRREKTYSDLKKNKNKAFQKLKYNSKKPKKVSDDRLSK